MQETETLVENHVQDLNDLQDTVHDLNNTVMDNIAKIKGIYIRSILINLFYTFALVCNLTIIFISSQFIPVYIEFNIVVNSIVDCHSRVTSKVQFFCPSISLNHRIVANNLFEISYYFH